MKREMNDIDFAGLERRLRMAPIGHRPAAPGSLHQFIASVPAIPQRSRFAVRLQGSAWLKRGGLGVAVAGALVVALVVSSSIVGIRSAQTAGPAAGSDWTWQKADGTMVGRISAVSHGYVSLCRSDSQPVGVLCTSRDGLSWRTPADPGIATIVGNAVFAPIQVVGIEGAYAALATDETRGGMSVWYSADGVVWQEADQSQFGGLSVSYLAELNGRLFAIAAGADPGSPGAALVSTNGSEWMKVSTLPAVPNITSSEDNVIEIAASGSGQEWATGDGLSWSRVPLPDSLSFIDPVRLLPDKSSIAVGQLASTPALQLLRGTNVLDWHADQGDLKGSMIALTVIGDRLVASVLDGVAPSAVASSSLPSDLRLWQSSDWGRTWQPLLGPDGQQLAGIGVQVGDRLGVEVPDAQSGRHLEWLGQPPATASPTPSVGNSGLSGPSSTPAAEITSSGNESTDPCSQRPAWFPALQTNLFGLSDWYEVADYFGAETYGCGFGGGAGLGSHLVVVGMCDSPQTIQVVLGAWDGRTGKGTPLAGFTVQCPTGTSGPQVVYRVDDVLPSLQGETVDIQVPLSGAGPYMGRYAFLVETTAQLSSTSPSAGPPN
jgi:hypothetical protein